MLYILDEPSIGLHQRDNAKLIETLRRLRDIGNTVIVVEHDEETMRASDWLIDMGPGAGEHGGRVVAEGTPPRVARTRGSVTGAFLSGRRRIAVPPRRYGDTPVLRVLRRRAQQPPRHRRRDPGRAIRGDHRRERLRQVDARQRRPVARPAEPAPPRSRQGGTAPCDRGPAALRQGDRHRPVADRSHAALEPRDLHRGCSRSFASSSRRRRMHARAATHRAGSRSTSRAVAARRARATG